MTPNELEAYDAMMHDRDRWRERAERLESFCPSDATPCSASPSDLLPPREIVEAAAMVAMWMESNGYKNWQLGGVCDRRYAKAQKLGPLDKEICSQCHRLALRVAHLSEALEAADDCLALVEDVGHGVHMDNVTVARGIITKAVSLDPANADVKPPSERNANEKNL